jgi:hypothetical protein
MALTKVQAAMIGTGTSSVAFNAGTPLYENTLAVATSYTLTAGTSAMSVGPIVINSGVSITIPSGSKWAIL